MWGGGGDGNAMFMQWAVIASLLANARINPIWLGIGFLVYKLSAAMEADPLFTRRMVRRHAHPRVANYLFPITGGRRVGE